MLKDWLFFVRVLKAPWSLRVTGVTPRYGALCTAKRVLLLHYVELTEIGSIVFCSPLCPRDRPLCPRGRQRKGLHAGGSFLGSSHRIVVSAMSPRIPRTFKTARTPSRTIARLGGSKAWKSCRFKKSHLGRLPRSGGCARR